MTAQRSPGQGDEPELAPVGVIFPTQVRHHQLEHAVSNT